MGMIELINFYGKNKYNTRDAVGDLLQYAAKRGDGLKAPYTVGIYCSCDYRKAKEDFLFIQDYYKYKNPAMKVRHLVIAPEDYIAPEVLVQWAFGFGEYFRGVFQVFLSVHIDSKKPHIHVIINTVSCADGKIYYSDMTILNSLASWLAGVTGYEVVAFNKCSGYDV